MRVNEAKVKRNARRNCSFKSVGSFPCEKNAELVDLGPKGVCIALRPPPSMQSSSAWTFPVQKRSGADSGLSFVLDPGYEYALDGKKLR